MPDFVADHTPCLAFFISRRYSMNATTIQNTNTNTQPCFRKTIDKTTYIVRVHFSETATETMADKIKRMLRDEVSKM